MDDGRIIGSMFKIPLIDGINLEEVTGEWL